MHFPLMEHLKRKNDLNRPQLGIVVENNDPKKLGRVKVRIKNLLEDANIDRLPWVYCRMPNNTYGGKGTAIYPPKLQAKLVIEFEHEDINFPVYTGYWSDKENTISHTDIQGFADIFKSNYPNMQGWDDGNGNYEAHNLGSNSWEWGYKSGYKRNLDKDGNLTDNNLKTYKMTVSDNYQIDNNNILLGTGATGHKALTTSDHLNKYDNLITSIDTWITGVTPILTAAAALAGIVTLPATSIAWTQSVAVNKENNENKTSQTKAK